VTRVRPSVWIWRPYRRGTHLKSTSAPPERFPNTARTPEAAWQAERVFFHGGGTDEEAKAAILRVDEIAQKIVALPTTDIEMMRLKARVYLWSEAEDFKTFAAKNEGDGSSEAALVSLFRDLGAGDPIGSNEETVTMEQAAALLDPEAPGRNRRV
jgi:hypothetical protein